MDIIILWKINYSNCNRCKIRDIIYLKKKKKEEKRKENQSIRIV